MSINGARKLLYGAVLTGWAGAEDEALYPVLFDNEPDRGVDTSAGYVQVLVRHGGSEQITLGPEGARRYTRNGLLFANVRIPLDANLSLGDRLAERVRGLVEGRTLTDGDGLSVWTFACDVQEQGPNEGTYWIVVETPFQYEVRR